MLYSLLADVIVVSHLTFVLFVLTAQFLIFAGGLFDWRWVRNPWFRFFHLFAILVVATQAVMGIECPMTTWEDNLRAKSEIPLEEATYLGQQANYILFYEASDSTFIWGYLAFLALVVLCMFWPAPRHAYKVFGWTVTLLIPYTLWLAPPATLPDMVRWLAVSGALSLFLLQPTRIRQAIMVVDEEPSPPQSGSNGKHHPHPASRESAYAKTNHN